MAYATSTKRLVDLRPKKFKTLRFRRMAKAVRLSEFEKGTAWKNLQDQRLEYKLSKS